MPPPITSAALRGDFVVLSFIETAQGICLGYQDSVGTSWSPTRSKVPGPIRKHRARIRGAALLVPEKLDEWVRHLAPPERKTPLAVYVSAPVPVASRPYESTARTVLDDAATGPFEVIRLAHPRGWREFEASLPLRVSSVEPTVSGTDLRRDPLVAKAATLRMGLQFAALDARGPLAVQGSDVVFLPGDLLDDAIVAATRIYRLSSRPRLLVAFEKTRGSAFPWVELPEGVALLRARRLDTVGRAEFGRAFVHALLENMPVHAAAASAWAAAAPKIAPSWNLTADPSTLSVLSWVGVTTRVLERASKLEGSLRTIDERLPSAEQRGAHVKRNDVRELRLALAEFEQMTKGFRRDPPGVVTLADALAKLSRLEKSYQRLANELEPRVRRVEQAAGKGMFDASFEEEVPDSTVHYYPPDALKSPSSALPPGAGPLERQPEGAPPPRSVDLELAAEDDRQAPITRDDALIPGRKYRLSVQIGAPFERSLLKTPPPPIDEHLDRASEHTIDVVVFGLDFSARSTVRRMLLPRRGHSTQVHFTLAAPKAEGPARFRVSLFHNEQLLQSLLVTAEVARTAERPHPIQVQVEHRRAKGFSELERVQSRALWVGLNDGPGATHTIMVKQGGTTQALHLPEAALAMHQASFREVLREATEHDGEPVFPPRGDPWAPVTPAFEDAVRKLVRRGRDMYLAVFGNAPRRVKDVLRTLASGEGKVIQVVRLDPGYVFPWQGLYVFDLPLEIDGEPPPPVCRGLDDRGEPCSHKPADAVFCVRGFWGVRHVVEQLLPGDDEAERATALGPADRNPAVRVAVGSRDDHSTALMAQLREDLGAGVVDAADPDDLLDMLWARDRRPVELVVIGHVETRNLPREPRGPRIQVAPDRWLMLQQVRDRAARECWTGSPRTLVLLMGCSTGATDMATLNDFALAFGVAGATALVSTECVAYTGLLARFARDVTAGLWQQRKRFGAAVRDAQTSLLNEGNPLAFVFTALGNADLVIAREVA